MNKLLLSLFLLIVSAGLSPLSAQKSEKLQLQKFRYKSYIDQNLLPNYFKASLETKEQILAHLTSALKDGYRGFSDNLNNSEETSDAFNYELTNQDMSVYDSKVPTLFITARVTLHQNHSKNHNEQSLKLKLSYIIKSPEDKIVNKKSATSQVFILENSKISIPFILSESQFSELFEEAIDLLFESGKKKNELEWKRASHPRYREFVVQAQHFHISQKGSKGFFKSKNTYHVTSADEGLSIRMSLQLGGFLLGKSKNYLFRKDWKYRRYQFKDPKQTLDYVYHSDQTLKKAHKETGNRPQHRMLILKEKELLGAFSLAEFLNRSYTDQIIELFGEVSSFSVMAGHYQDEIYHFRYLEKDKITEIYKNGELTTVLQENLSGKFHRRRSMDHELFVKGKVTESSLNTILRLYLAFTIARNSELKQLRYGN